jgi:hypothetical protein
VNKIEDFIKKVITIYKTGVATEHSYRSVIENLFNSLSENISAINEPKRVACGAPDFIVQRGDLVVGHVEAKDIGIGLRGMKDANKNQQDRYRKALPNLIYTNCLDWDFYRNGELIASVTIADYLLGIQPNPERYELLEKLLREFISQRPQAITSSRVLAEMMAGKAQLIKDVLHNALVADKDLQTALSSQYEAFKEHLIHDITTTDFADIYAETIAYGMFAARLHDTSLDNFSRQEALVLLPKSNPFLRSLFSYLAGVDLDERIAWIIDDLAAVFQVADVAEIMNNFGKLTGQTDPFLHFYETFLAAYNPAKRKARGVWYTPESVVNFIVRAVDEVLQKEFGLADGIADTSKITVDWDTGQFDKKGKSITIKKDVHRVQILDPATGTGTFLAEAIKQIAPKIKNVAPSMWSSYIEKDLIPRLHGFELLMASYAMCHMKLDMILTELGYKPSGVPPRLSVYLTNSLEEGEAANQSLPFAQWLSNEVKQANTIKRDMPIMCVIGNPPYSGESSNKSEWIMDLMEAYKKEPGGKQKLQEKNPKWINDDYVKFIRMAENLINENGEGVLGFITNHGYLDNPTFRGMRWHLLNTFDKLYVLDLHGNSKKKEVTPEGKADVNVFDIQQGVAIIVGVKYQSIKTVKKSLAQVFHSDLFGSREYKYKNLYKYELYDNNVWKILQMEGPQYDFVPRDYGLKSIYEKGFGIQALMPVNSNGVLSFRDDLAIDCDPNRLWERVKDFNSLENDEARRKYNLGKDSRDWTLTSAKFDIKNNLSENNIKTIAYRPFDKRWMYYTGNTKGFMSYPRKDFMRNLLDTNAENFAILIGRQGQAVGASAWNLVLCVNCISDLNIYYRGGGVSFPLYLYPDKNELDQARRTNLEENICTELQLKSDHPVYGKPNEVAVFDYVYGILHCPGYRKIYSEFLKTDFPRIPWPRTPDEFWHVSNKGTLLRKLHLMEPAAVGQTPYPLMGEGECLVEKLLWQNGKVWINSTQYFDHVPEISWLFSIGGYQPAQKWLKDRKGRNLSFEDVKHYQKIIKVLFETKQIMDEIKLEGIGE